MKTHLNNIGANLLIESMINGRPISTYKFLKPVEYDGGSIGLLELPYPSATSKYKSGLQHIEVVLRGGLSLPEVRKLSLGLFLWENTPLKTCLE